LYSTTFMEGFRFGAPDLTRSGWASFPAPFPGTGVSQPGMRGGFWVSVLVNYTRARMVITGPREIFPVPGAPTDLLLVVPGLFFPPVLQHSGRKPCGTLSITRTHFSPQLSPFLLTCGLPSRHKSAPPSFFSGGPVFLRPCPNPALFQQMILYSPRAVLPWFANFSFFSSGPDKFCFSASLSDQAPVSSMHHGHPGDPGFTFSRRVNRSVPF